MDGPLFGQHKMGKYAQCTHANCRQCRLENSSGNQHVTSIRKSQTERRDTQRMRNESANYSTVRSRRRASDCSSNCSSNAQTGQAEIHNNCANCAHSNENLCGTMGYRGKQNIKSRSRSLAGKTQPRFMTRSISCGSMRYDESNASDAYTSSETDSETSEIFSRDDSSTIDTCKGCNGENSLERYRGFPSMPNLVKATNNSNNSTKENTQAGSNHLGLEVMLSLINGPMQSIIDSKDEKIRNLERAIERLECENKQIKQKQAPGDATKIFTLEKTLENCVRQIEQLEETNKTAQEKVQLLEDLRKNDKECIDILRTQTNNLEMKLTKSDERVREAEKEGKNQGQWLKQNYERQIEELQSALRAKDAKLRELDKIKSRIAKQKQELEDKRNNENKLHAKMCEQVIGLKRDLQLHQTRLNVLEREKRSLEENLSQSENLQRQDQKSSYVLQMKIVELQEKLDMSQRKSEELNKQREIADSKCQVLEERLKQASKTAAKWHSDERDLKEGLFNTLEQDGSHTKANKPNGSHAINMQLQTARDELKSETSEKCTTAVSRRMSLEMNDVLREKVVELQKKCYKERQATCNDRASNETHVEDLGFCEQSEKWELKEDGCDEESLLKDSMEAVPVRDTPLKKMETAFTGDKRRPSSDDSCSSASSSRRGSAESPRVERRQLKVLKVRKVSKENISQFQQNAAYMMNRQSFLKDVREGPNSSSSEKISFSSGRQSAFEQVKDRTFKM